MEGLAATGSNSAARVLHRLPGVASKPPLMGELGVVMSALVAIGSVPALPLLMMWLLWRAWKAEDPDARRKARRWFALILGLYLFLALVPTVARPRLVQGPLFRWWLEYFSVSLAYRGGKPLPPGQYLFLMLPHGLYPFSGACATISEMVDVFSHMQIAVAPAALRLPFIRQLMGWIGCIRADKDSIRAALRRGASVGLFPGGIGEMLRTDAASERILLQDRKGFVQLALEQGVPIVPVYVFGQSVLWSQLQLPQWVQRLSRWLRVSLILPYGRFGMLVPHKLPLLYTIGEPIACPRLEGPSTEQITATHGAVVRAVRELYNFYKDIYGWQERPLVVE